MDAARRLEEARELLLMIGVDADRLSEEDREFVSSLRTKIERFGERTKVSKKQLFWLRDIKDRILDGSAFEEDIEDLEEFEEDLSDA